MGGVLERTASFPWTFANDSWRTFSELKIIHFVCIFVAAKTQRASTLEKLTNL